MAGVQRIFAAVLLATGLGARRNRMLPTPLVWATIVIGASQLTPLGFLGSLLLPPWLIGVGLWFTRRHDHLIRAERDPNLMSEIGTAAGVSSS